MTKYYVLFTHKYLAGVSSYLPFHAQVNTKKSSPVMQN